jgi:drug/metabolite transporter (DMT)-like permease
MKRGLVLGAVALVVFGLVTALMLRFMPTPMKESDYVIVGSVATLVALGVLFVMLISTTRSSDVFFKKKRKK